VSGNKKIGVFHLKKTRYPTSIQAHRSSTKANRQGSMAMAFHASFDRWIMDGICYSGLALPRLDGKDSCFPTVDFSSRSPRAGTKAKGQGQIQVVPEERDKKRPNE
jgi:hypothetical protein